MTDTPHGYTRGDDGVLRIAPVAFGRFGGEANEAVKQGDAFICTSRARGQHSFNSHTCGKTAKHDPDHNGNPTRCGIHSQAAKDRRKAKSDAKQAERHRKFAQGLKFRKLQAEAVRIVRQIADGHNDPRGLRADWVKREGEG